MSYENIAIEHKDQVSWLTLQRPKVLNALNRKTIAELASAIDECAQRAARVVVLTGAGERAFVAGADIKEMMEWSPLQATNFAREGQAVFRQLETMDAVTIAAVNGFALGGGCELMLACDFAIASDRASFGQPEVGLGVTPGFGGTVRLGKRIGVAKALQLLVTGESLSAAEALKLGLVNETVPATDLLRRVEDIAQQIVKNAPVAVKLTKRSARIASEMFGDSAFAYEAEVFGQCFSTTDQKEGMRAFGEKRAATWEGR